MYHFSWNKRSCQYYATLLPLLYYAIGAMPYERQCEEAQGFGRQCMQLWCAKKAIYIQVWPLGSIKVEKYVN